MIKLLRVDHRLLHGQVAFSWTGYLGADCILIANDDVVTNDLRRSTIKLAKPANTKLVIKTVEDSIQAIVAGQTDKYHLFIVVDCIHDAYQIAKAVDEIHSINLGGIAKREGTRLITKSVNLLPKEEKELQELSAMGKEIEMRLVPNDKKKIYGK